MADLISDNEPQAHGLVGAVIGRHHVTGRVRPGKRWHYTVHDPRTGQPKFMRGHEVVRLARDARQNGLPVVAPAQPWRDEGAA